MVNLSTSSKYYHQKGQERESRLKPLLHRAMCAMRRNPYAAFNPSLIDERPEFLGPYRVPELARVLARNVIP